MPLATVTGQDIFYTDSDPGADPSRPVIAFSHGLLMNNTMFAAQITAFAPSFRCIAWDERGHGKTNHGAVPAPFTYWDSADDLAALLGHLGIKRAILAGMSQGGYLSLRTALRYPGLVRALVLLDTQAGPEDAEAKGRNDTFVSMWKSNGINEFLLAAAETTIIGPGFAEIETWREYWRAFPADNFAACIDTLNGRDDLGPRLGEITCPALVVHGTDDVAIPMSKAQALADGLGAALVEIKGAGHAANMSHHVEVNAAIEAFLGGLGAQ